MSGKKLVLLTTLILLASACSAQPTQLPPTPTSAPTQASLPLSEQQVPRVTVEDARARAAFVLLHNGYPRVSALLGGFGSWIEAGYPVEP